MSPLVDIFYFLSVKTTQREMYVKFYFNCALQIDPKIMTVTICVCLVNIWNSIITVYRVIQS